MFRGSRSSGASRTSAEASESTGGPCWRGRVQVAICFNMDLGDAWEWADYPPYPERYAALAYRIGVNYVVYAMTH